MDKEKEMLDLFLEYAVKMLLITGCIAFSGMLISGVYVVVQLASRF